MPQQLASKDYLTFVKGIITEANPLTFPENASIDEQNFVLNRDGSRQRRLGMDYEQDFVLNDTGNTSLDFENIGVSTHTWKNINEDTNLSFHVIQFGNDLYFYDALEDSVSSNPKNGGNSITLDGDANIKWQTSNLGGRFIVVTGSTNVFSLEYDSVSDVVTSSAHGLLTRDLWGVDDGLDTDERPATLTANHEYNLRNQGWGSDDSDSPLSYYENFRLNSGLNLYPSNADLVQTGKQSSDNNKFNAKFVARSFAGSTPAPKGRFIIDLFDRSQARGLAVTNPSLLSNIGFAGGVWSQGVFGSILELNADPLFNPNPSFLGLGADRSTTGSTVTASYAERIFYSGMKSEKLGGDSKSPLLGHLIFFTQLVDAQDKIGKCYQEADPTSEEQSDLVATDGGFIKIPGMSICLKLVSYADSLVVLSENGVWEIKGGESGFKATDFQVIKLTDIGAINANSIVEAEDRIYFWSKAGIYVITRDQVTLGLQITNISETTVQTLFESFSNVARNNTTGTYDSASKRIRWLLNNESGYNGSTERFRYSTEIVYDVVLNAFYVSKLPETDGDTPYIAEFLNTTGFLTSQKVDNVVVNGEQVVVNDESVVITSNIRVGDTTKVLYLTIDPNLTSVTNYTYTFSFYRDSSFEDWPTALGTGIDANGFMLTGYETGGDIQRQKQATYMTVHFTRTETGFEDIGGGNLEAINPSSCFIQAQWDFADSATSGKFGPKFQAYRLNRPYIPSGPGDLFDYGQVVITTKNKLRGRGKALSLLFETEAGKDLILLGWGMIFGANTNV